MCRCVQHSDNKHRSTKGWERVLGINATTIQSAIASAMNKGRTSAIAKGLEFTSFRYERRNLIARRPGAAAGTGVLNANEIETLVRWAEQVRRDQQILVGILANASPVREGGGPQSGGSFQSSAAHGTEVEGDSEQ